VVHEGKAACHAAERLRLTGLHAEAKPIFTLVAYRRTAKFSDNQTKRGGNSYEDREHKRDPHGRRVELPAPNHGNRHQHRAILYDIYCLMLWRYGSSLLDRRNSLPNRRDYPQNHCNCLNIILLPFRSRDFRLHGRLGDKTSETNSIWSLSLSIQCFARSQSPGYRNRSAAVSPFLPFLANSGTLRSGMVRRAGRSLHRQGMACCECTRNVLFRRTSHSFYCDTVSFK
jgi:hypothetical protein